MTKNGFPFSKTSDFYSSCDFYLLKLYLNFEVDDEFSDLNHEVLEELQDLGFLIKKELSWQITRSGRQCVQNGGIKKYLNNSQSHPTSYLDNHKLMILLEFPFLVAILVCFLMIICILTWTYLILM